MVPGNQIFTPPLFESVRDINGDGRPEVQLANAGADAVDVRIYVWDGREFAALFERTANRVELLDRSY